MKGSKQEVGLLTQEVSVDTDSVEAGRSGPTAEAIFEDSSGHVMLPCRATQKDINP